MKNLLFTIQGYIYQFIFGGRCLGCRRGGPAICQKCLYKIPFSEGTENPNIYGLFDYGNTIVNKAIWNLKYKHRGQEIKILTQYGSQMINEIVAEHLQSSSPQNIYLVPIPQHKSKTQTRGFNQSLLIAQWLTQTIPNSQVKNVLEKTRQTLPQSHLQDRRLRLQNAHDTMRVAKQIDPKQIYIVIDDVTTTGATFLEAIRVLKNAGAKNILCIALAHGYKRK